VINDDFIDNIKKEYDEKILQNLWILLKIFLTMSIFTLSTIIQYLFWLLFIQLTFFMNFFCLNMLV
jgi:hypothetical protein